jgi:CxxC motif-containing protein (DUF1111 family)
MVVFAGEASNVELGRTNEMFETERDETPGCLFNRTPEDHMNLDAGTSSDMMPDLIKLSLFMEFLAPPVPATSYGNVTAQSIANGQNLFLSAKVGCALCHTPQFPLSPSSTDAVAALQQANLFSDLLVHHMGPGLADDVIQGDAGPDEFRTAPLWGVGQRIFFLHDGRTSDLLAAIEAHDSPGNGCGSVRGDAEGRDDHTPGCRSEAQQVIENFNKLTAAEKQDVLNFLRSL